MSPTIQSTFDVLLSQQRTIQGTFDVYVVKRVQSTFDALVVDIRGSFRGTMTAAERDALVAIQVGDTVLVTDDGRRLEHQVWNGTDWLKARQQEAPESGAE